MLNSVAGGLSQAAESNANNGRGAPEKSGGGILDAVRKIFSGGENGSQNSFGGLFGGGQPTYPEIRAVSLTPVVPGYRPQAFDAAQASQGGNDFQYFSKSSDFAGIGESATPLPGENHSNLNNPWNLMFS